MTDISLHLHNGTVSFLIDGVEHSTGQPQWFDTSLGIIRTVDNVLEAVVETYGTPEAAVEAANTAAAKYELDTISEIADLAGYIWLLVAMSVES